ncbi:MAG TPA: type IV pilus twitching motility protein PilT [Planctomycetota bacterium]|nr:type IV pilus twitching motility protein PilT [Planctomycetota bacterium]
MIDINVLLHDLIHRRGSDLHLKIGRPPLMRLAGEIVPTDAPALTEADVEAALKQILGAEGWAKLQQEGELDAAYAVPDLARFRVNAFRRMGQYGVIARAIPLKVPTLDSLNMPPAIKDLLNAPQGLILVTGPTGSGKSTTLACMIEQLNQTLPLHVITLEDPIEFVYTDAKAEITQRQLGTDVATLHEGLRRILRQDPDVILIGELRDRETIETAMHAAETGHLVLSTLHTNDAKQTIDRIIDTFPADSRDHIRSMLSLTLHAIISQRLLRRASGGGRVAAMEILINTPNVRELIAAGKIREIEAAMKGGDFYRMQTFNQALAKLVHEGTITEEEAAATTQNANELRMILRGITSGASSTRTPQVPAPAGTAPPADSTKKVPSIPAAKPEPAAPAPEKPPGLKITRGF